MKSEIKQDVFKAIADPTRRAILLLLAVQSATPNALAEEFDTTRQAVSKHIKVLAECGMVKQNRSGREIYYELQPEKLNEVDGWIQTLKQQWQSKFEQLDTVLQQLKNKRK